MQPGLRLGVPGLGGRDVCCAQLAGRKARLAEASSAGEFCLVLMLDVQHLLGAQDVDIGGGGPQEHVLLRDQQGRAPCVDPAAGTGKSSVHPASRSKAALRRLTAPTGPTRNLGCEPLAELLDA